MISEAISKIFNQKLNKTICMGVWQGHYNKHTDRMEVSIFLSAIF